MSDPFDAAQPFGQKNNDEISRFSRRFYASSVKELSEDDEYVDMSRFITDKESDFIGVFWGKMDKAWVLDVQSVNNFLKNFRYKILLIDPSSDYGDVHLYCKGMDMVAAPLKIKMLPSNMFFDLNVYSKRLPTKTLIEVGGYQVEYVEQINDDGPTEDLQPKSVFYPMNEMKGNRLSDALFAMSKEMEDSESRARSLGIYR